MKNILNLLTLFITVFTTNAQWAPVGPYGGTVTCLAANGSRVYAGAYYGGIFLSTDGGNTWAPSNNGLGSGLNVKSLTSSSYGVFAANQNGIFLSTDSGANWMPTGSNLPPYEGGPIATKGDTVFVSMGDAGVWLSANRGTTWASATTGIPQGALVISFVVAGNNVFAGTVFSGVYKYNNDGKSWISASNGLPELPVSALATDGVHLYAGTNKGVYLSDINATQWQAQNDGLSDSLVTALLFTAGHIYAGTVNGGIFYSADSGRQWMPDNYGTMSSTADISALTSSSAGVIAGLNNTTLNSQGVSLSSDGVHWNTSNKGFSNTSIMDILNNENNLFCSAWPNGVFLSADDGNNWNTADSSLPGSDIGVIDVGEMAAFGNYWFASGSFNGIYVSGNNGAYWQQYGPEIVQALTIGLNGNTVFAATNNQVFISTDSGQVYTVDSSFPGEDVYEFASSNNNVFMGAETGVYVSRDNGMSWDSCPLPPAPNALGANGTTTIVGYRSPPSVYISTDNANTWMADNNFPPGLYARAFLVTGSGIYAGTDSGVFFSTGNGNWIPIGLAGYSVITLSSNDSIVFAGTNEDGIWRLPISQIATDIQQVVSPSPTGIRLFPNPNATGSVQLQVNDDLLYSLWNLRNLTGQLIGNGIIENNITGINTINLPAGIYLVSVQSSSEIVTKKLVIEK